MRARRHAAGYRAPVIAALTVGVASREGPPSRGQASAVASHTGAPHTGAPDVGAAVKVVARLGQHCSMSPC